MLIRDFEVYDDNGALVEVLPAVLYGGGRVNVKLNETGSPVFNTVLEIVAQVPASTTQVDFINADTNEVLATVPVVNRKAILKVDWRKVGTLRVRVGAETKMRLNEAVVEGYVE